MGIPENEDEERMHREQSTESQAMKLQKAARMSDVKYSAVCFMKSLNTVRNE